MSTFQTKDNKSLWGADQAKDKRKRIRSRFWGADQAKNKGCVGLPDEQQYVATDETANPNRLPLINNKIPNNDHIVKPEFTTARV